MESNKYKYYFYAAITFIIVGFVYIIWQQYKIAGFQENIDRSIVEMKELSDKVVRSQSQYATKDDLEKIAKDLKFNLDEVEDDLDKLNANVVAINQVLASTPGYDGHGLPSDGTEPNENPTEPISCPDGTCPDPYGYLSNAQILSLMEPFSDGTAIPFGETKFKAWQENPWDLKIYPRNYNVTTVLGQDEEGRHYAYNKFSVTSQGQEYSIKINDAKLVEVYPESKFRWSPRLYLGADIGTHLNPPSAEVTPNLQVTLFSKGRTKVNPDWTFVGVGVGFESQNKNISVLLSPFNYNVGQLLPLMNNLYVGPTLGVNPQGNISVMGGVRVGL